MWSLFSTAEVMQTQLSSCYVQQLHTTSTSKRGNSDCTQKVSHMWFLPFFAGFPIGCGLMWLTEVEHDQVTSTAGFTDGVRWTGDSSVLTLKLAPKTPCNGCVSCFMHALICVVQKQAYFSLVSLYTLLHFIALHWLALKWANGCKSVCNTCTTGSHKFKGTCRMVSRSPHYHCCHALLLLTHTHTHKIVT